MADDQYLLGRAVGRIGVGWDRRLALGAGGHGSVCDHAGAVSKHRHSARNRRWNISIVRPAKKYSHLTFTDRTFYYVNSPT
jgi:hypothetical protein